jgi:hypothetical protein
MSKEADRRGALEITFPDETLRQRLDAIMSVARACERLADALMTATSTVIVNGNVTACGSYGVKSKKRKT